jgi:hypothetical protein
VAHRRFEFIMPASPEVVFDAFHHHRWRQRWDSLVRSTRVVGGAECPSVGAITENGGAGLLKMLSMRTRFVSYERPKVAAATMVGTSFPFRRWAASMRHRPEGPGSSVLIYTYSFDVAPRALRGPLEPVVAWAFDRQTRRRFERLQRFLAEHGEEIRCWQARRAAQAAKDAFGSA